VHFYLLTLSRNFFGNFAAYFPEKELRKQLDRHQRGLPSVSVLVKARECMAEILCDLSHGRNAGASTQIDAIHTPFLVVVFAAF
jgi:hypothetical protein